MVDGDIGFAFSWWYYWSFSTHLGNICTWRGVYFLYPHSTFGRGETVVYREVPEEIFNIFGGFGLRGMRLLDVREIGGDGDGCRAEFRGSRKVGDRFCKFIGFSKLRGVSDCGDGVGGICFEGLCFEGLC